MGKVSVLKALAILLLAAPAAARDLTIRSRGRGVTDAQAERVVSRALDALGRSKTGRALMERWRAVASTAPVVFVVDADTTAAMAVAWVGEPGRPEVRMIADGYPPYQAGDIAQEWLGRGLAEVELRRTGADPMVTPDLDLVGHARGWKVLLELEPDAHASFPDLKIFFEEGPWFYFNKVIRHPTYNSSLAVRLEELARARQFFRDRADYIAHAARMLAELPQAQAKAARYAKVAAAVADDPEAYERLEAAAVDERLRKLTASWDKEIDDVCDWGRKKLGLKGKCPGIAGGGEGLAPFRFGETLADPDTAARERLDAAIRQLGTSREARLLIGRWAALGGGALTIEVSTSIIRGEARIDVERGVIRLGEVMMGTESQAAEGLAHELAHAIAERELWVHADDKVPPVDTEPIARVRGLKVWRELSPATFYPTYRYQLEALGKDPASLVKALEKLGYACLAGIPQLRRAKTWYPDCARRLRKQMKELEDLKAQSGEEPDEPWRGPVAAPGGPLVSAVPRLNVELGRLEERVKWTESQASSPEVLAVVEKAAKAPGYRRLDKAWNAEIQQFQDQVAHDVADMDAASR